MEKTFVSIIGALALVLTVSVAAAASDIDTERALPADGRFRLMNDDPLSFLDRMASLCADSKGGAVYIIPKRHGSLKRLTEVSLEEARQNALSPEGYWIMACDGEMRFLAEKESKAMNKGTEVASFHLNRGLSGVDYIKNEDAIQRVDTAVDPAETDAFLKEMAWEVNAIGLDFVKAKDGRRYAGERTGKKGLFCEGVAIKELDGTAVSKVHDFRVCASRVVKDGERPASESMLARY